MKFHLIKALCLAATALLVAGGVVHSASAAPSDGEVVIPVHRSELISLPADISEVLIANPNVADVFVHGTSKVSIVGKSIGITSLRVLDANSQVLRSLTIRVTYDLPAIRQSLHQFFPYEDISVETVSNNLALTGMVSSAAVAAKAVMIVNEYLYASPAEGGPVEGTPASNRPRGERFGPTNNIVEGSDTGVINMLKVTSGQQVMLRVRVGEMQRNALKQLGVNWSGSNPGNFLFGTGTDFSGQENRVVGDLIHTVTPDSFGVALGQLNIGGAAISAAIEALEENNLFKVLAEPNIVAISGEEAEFLAGGEFPIPVAQNQDVTIEYKQFGVSVRFLPTVISDSRIRILVKPEISELSDIGAVTLNGFTVPALSTRRARTTVELAPGESFMIAGLLRDQIRSTIRQVPGLGEVPILSSLFRSTQFQRNETELVIAVTPYLVDPVTGDDVRLPTDNYRPPSMMEQFFYGALGSLSAETLRVSQTPLLEGPIGFMVD